MYSSYICLSNSDGSGRVKLGHKRWSISISVSDIVVINNVEWFVAIGSAQLRS